MSYRIAISDGHDANTPGKRTPPIPELGGRVIRENEFNHIVATLLDEELQRCGFETLMVAPGRDFMSLADRVKRSNDFKADAHIAIHYDAFDGSFDGNDPEGMTIFIYSGSIKGRKLAENVLKYLKEGTPQINRGIKDSNFYELKYTNCPAILTENGFMDNKREAMLMIDPDFQKEVAREHAMGICDYFGVQYIPAIPPKSDTVIYKVQLGAFSIRGNAITLSDTLKKQGFSTYIIEEDGLHKVQVGAFRIRDNALDLINDLKKFGHTPYLRVYGEEVKFENYRKIVRYGSNVHIFEADSSHNVRMELGVRRKLETVSTIMRDQINTGKNVVAGVNAGFFDSSREHLGGYINDGLYFWPPDNAFVDFIYYKDGRTEVINLHGYDKTLLSGLQKTAHFAIGTSYALVVNGKINLMNTDKHSHSSQYHPRTMIGQLKNGNIVLVVVDGRTSISRGMTATQQAQLMLELGCINAVNLDGGGSSTMCVVENGTVRVKNYPSDKGVQRAVGSAVVVYKK